MGWGTRLLVLTLVLVAKNDIWLPLPSLPTPHSSIAHHTLLRYYQSSPIVLVQYQSSSNTIHPPEILSIVICLGFLIPNILPHPHHQHHSTRDIIITNNSTVVVVSLTSLIMRKLLLTSPSTMVIRSVRNVLLCNPEICNKKQLIRVDLNEDTRKYACDD